MADSKFDFIKKFDKEIAKMDGIVTTAEPPKYWYSTGNFVLNKVLSGSYRKGIPQGRITNLAGPSGAGKSFIAANLAKAAQTEGAYCLIIDSENALDDDFMTKIGVDVNNMYRYCSVVTIPEVTKVVSAFLHEYKQAVADAKDPLDIPQVFILIDSLDMLTTETEAVHFEKGVTKGDQGQKNRQLKAMLRTFVQAIKTLDIALVCTSQVYANQDLMNGEGLWIVANAVKYACSQICLIQKRKLKDESKGAKAGDVAGIRMICEGYKTRFTRPFQKVEIEVPYETGMDPFSGLLDVAKLAGVVIQNGSWFRLADTDELWRGSDIATVADTILDRLDQQSIILDIPPDVEIDTDTETKSDTKTRRKQKVLDEIA